MGDIRNKGRGGVYDGEEEVRESERETGCVLFSCSVYSNYVLFIHELASIFFHGWLVLLL